MSGEDLRLPQAVIARIIKEALPENVSVSKECKTAIARSAAVFILHTTNFANENAIQSKRKTITASDVLHAVRMLECDELEQPVREAVEVWNTSRLHKTEETRKRKAAKAVVQEGISTLPHEDVIDDRQEEDDDTVRNGSPVEPVSASDHPVDNVDQEGEEEEDEV